jgi:peptidoglycan/xylan/chitin deacetylase (PgdA/CDA1 family)
MCLLVSIVVVGVVGAILNFGIPLIYGKWCRKALKQSAIANRTMVLTFDDGPGNRLTPAILAILSECNVKATFFLIGRNIPEREHIVQRIAAEGHDICSHGFNHLNAWKVWPWQSIRDIKRGWVAIDRVLGTCKGTYPFRPPYGKLNLVTLLYLWSKYVPIIYWTADIGDTWPQEKRKRQIHMEWVKMHEGAVVLAHDFDRTTDRIDDYVLEAIQKCLTIAWESQLKVCTFSELRKTVK